MEDNEVAYQPLENQHVCTEECKGESKYFLVKIRHSSEIEICDGSLEGGIQTDDWVVVPTKYGSDLGKILGPICHHKVYNQSVFTIERRATEADLESSKISAEKEAHALEICRDKISKHELDMKLVSAHYLLEGNKVLFFFTSEGRVDFRELVKDLVSIFKMRIELRQIGVRDEARVVGALGVCGRSLCCHSITDKLRPVSIKMAKDQNLSLNSMKISGPCGRLLCCLAYEHDFYAEQRAKYPNVGQKIFISGRLYRLDDSNILRLTGRLSGAEGNVILIKLDDLHYDEATGQWNHPEPK